MINNKNNLTIGKDPAHAVKLENPFILAPLAGITDGPFRRICRQMGAALVYSEMVSAKGLWYKDKNTEKLLQILDGEDPVAFQIFGHEPEIIAYAAEVLSSRKNVILDINMGCPVPKVVKNGEGSALMKNPDLVYKVARAAVSHTDKPVTVKIRAGWDTDNINAVEVARAAAAAGVSAVAVHGRTREQFYNGKADWSVIAAVKDAIDVPVIGNGDVTSGESAMRMMAETGCDFVMIGRGALGNPWIFKELAAVWNEQTLPPAPSLEDKKEMMIRHFNDVLALKGEYAAVREMRKHVGWYLKGAPGSAAFRGRVNQLTTAEALTAAIRNI